MPCWLAASQSSHMHELKYTTYISPGSVSQSSRMHESKRIPYRCNPRACMNQNSDGCWLQLSAAGYNPRACMNRKPAHTQIKKVRWLHERWPIQSHPIWPLHACPNHRHTRYPNHIRHKSRKHPRNIPKKSETVNMSRNKPFMMIYTADTNIGQSSNQYSTAALLAHAWIKTQDFRPLQPSRMHESK